jgi:hypothetical protein
MANIAATLRAELSALPVASLPVLYHGISLEPLRHEDVHMLRKGDLLIARNYYNEIVTVRWTNTCGHNKWICVEFEDGQTSGNTPECFSLIPGQGNIYNSDHASSELATSTNR